MREFERKRFSDYDRMKNEERVEAFVGREMRLKSCR